MNTSDLREFIRWLAKEVPGKSIDLIATPHILDVLVQDFMAERQKGI